MALYVCFQSNQTPDVWEFSVSTSLKRGNVGSGDRNQFKSQHPYKNCLFLAHVDSVLHRIDGCISICGSDTTFLDGFKTLNRGTLGR